MKTAYPVIFTKLSDGYAAYSPDFPFDPKSIKCEPGEFVSMVDIDFTEYRKANDRRTVRRNVSLPLPVKYGSGKGRR